jgi:hypothetical protein
MSIGLEVEAAGLGVEAAQVGCFAGLPVRWPRAFRQVVTAPATLASLGSLPSGLEEVAQGHVAFKPRSCP